MNSIKQIILISIFCLALAVGVGAVFAWIGPTAAPPGGNTPAPINIGLSTQYKSGILGVGGILRGYSNAIFDGNVGIGTSLPQTTLSVLGTISLLRQPGTSVAPGPGPSIFLQSPSNNTSTVTDNDEFCTTGLCTTDNTPTGSLENTYTCPVGSGGNVYDKDVYKKTATEYWRRSVTCVAGTENFSLRTDAGVLNFLNNSNAVKMNLNQGGDMWVANKITAPQFCIGTDCKTAWPAAGAGGITDVTGTAPIIVSTSGTVKNVSIDSCTTSGQVLQWNGTNWICATVASGGIAIETDPTVPSWAKAIDDSKYLNTTSTSQTIGGVGVKGIIGTLYPTNLIAQSIGIGTTAPGAKLELVGDGANSTAAKIILRETGSSLGVFFLESEREGSGNRLDIGEGSDTFFTIRSDEYGGGTTTRGNVGIGTTDPGVYKLKVDGSIGGNSADILEISTNNLTATNNISINSGILTLRPGSADTSKGKKPSETVWRVPWSHFDNWDFTSTQTDTCSTESEKDVKDFTCTGYNIAGPCYDRAEVKIGDTNYGFATRQIQCFATSGVYVIKNEGNTLKFIKGDGTASVSIGQDGITTFSNQIKISGGVPGESKVLTSDANGLASWETPPSPPTIDESKYLNTSDSIQSKTGALSLGSLGVTGALRGYSTAIFDGNVGIGTTAPTNPLYVSNNNSGMYTGVFENLSTSIETSILTLRSGHRASLSFKSVLDNYGWDAYTGWTYPGNNWRFVADTCPGGVTVDPYTCTILDQVNCQDRDDYAPGCNELGCYRMINCKYEVRIVEVASDYVLD